jgi:predicted regulator of Ras-like GTPase activity (Roadblock/LC7/MglB family)
MADRSSNTATSNAQSQTGSSDVLSIQEALDELMDVDGAIGAAVVDYENGMTLGTVGGRDLDMELAGAGTTEVVRSEHNIINDLGLNERVEDLLISLNSQYHLVRMCQRHDDVFIYLVINRDKGNLGLARRSIDQIDERLELT